MANKIYLNSTFGYREDTLKNWQTANPVLEKGEISFVRDGENGRFVKIGDGHTAWNSLPFAPLPKGEKGDQGPAGERGKEGADYVLTEADKLEIADMAKPVADQTYNPESNNAQSGTAVAEAVSPAIPNDFEVIAEGELTESVNTILIDKDKDGNSLALQDVVSFYFYSPKNEKAKNVTIVINNKLVGQAPTMKATSENYSKAFSIYTGCQWETFCLDGAWTGLGTVQARGINPLAPQDAKTHNRVNTIKLYCYNSADVLPIGFKYKIYGRRAKQ